MTRIKKRIADVAFPLIFGIFFVYIWQKGVFHDLGKLTAMQLPYPDTIAKKIAELFLKIMENAFVTLQCALTGLAIGSILGYIVALIAAAFPKWGYGGLIVLSAVNAVPIIALAPLMNRWFDTAFGAKTGVATVVCLAAMALNAYKGLTDLKPFSEDLMKSYAATKSVTIIKLRIPNSLPNVFTALKINIASAMIASLISEYFASDPMGVGFQIKQAMTRGNTRIEGWAYITSIAVISVIVYLIITMVERCVIKWHASQR